MLSKIKTLEDLIGSIEPGIKIPDAWQIRAIQSEECISYITWNTLTHEAIAVDPKVEDWESYQEIIKSIPGYRWIGVFDTHTHADHVSIAAKFSETVMAPLFMHASSPSKKPHFKVSHHTSLNTQAGKLKLWITPGHTPDSITIAWGPFLFTGDLILFGDTGRDDLPGGNATDHFESLELIKKNVSIEAILLPGHDRLGGRASTLSKQLEINSSLIQNRDDFIRESEAFDAPAPALLKASLKENFK